MSSVLPARALSFLRRNMTNNDNAVYCYIRDDDDNFALFGQHSLEKSTNANVVHNNILGAGSCGRSFTLTVDCRRSRAGAGGGRSSHSEKVFSFGGIGGEELSF